MAELAAKLAELVEVKKINRLEFFKASRKALASVCSDMNADVINFDP